MPLFQVFPLWLSGFSPGWARLGGSRQENLTLASVDVHARTANGLLPLDF